MTPVANSFRCGSIAYSILARISSGGMADIFLGIASHDTGFKRPCVIKRMLPEFGREPKHVDQFRREAEVGQSLQHANVIQVYGFERFEDTHILVMEYVHGANLLELIQVCQSLHIHVSVPMAVYIASEASRGLYYAHTRKNPFTGEGVQIIHRDISPANILVSAEGEVKLADFGVARMRQSPKNEKSTSLVGKLGYLSPEQLEEKEPDVRSDIFSLGIVTWELLAQSRLFGGKSRSEALDKLHQFKAPARLSQFNPEVNEELERIVFRALSRNPDQRYQSAAEFEKALSKYLHVYDPSFTPKKLGSFVQIALSDRLKKVEDILKTAYQSLGDKLNEPAKAA